ncbi:NosD domain-containing protein [Thermus sp.]|uniref:right-handed parallel beta-helix repeat-containing protein n=1 Tax=Thermus sp. TaxID=275 RepID=UPI00307F081C
MLRLQGDLQGPLVLNTPGLQVEAQGATLRGTQGHTLVLNAPGIRVRGLRVVGAGPSSDFFDPHAGVYLEGCEGCLLEGLEVEGAPTAVRLENSPGAKVRGIKARGMGEAPGVLAYRSPGVQVEGSELSGFMDGIYLEYTPEARILENRLLDHARYAWHVMLSWGVEVRGNLSFGNGVGSAIMHGAENRVVGNRFLGERAPIAYGLLVQGERGTAVEANLFGENTIGLVLMDSQGVLVRANRFEENGTALRITRERGENSAQVMANVFQGNLYDLLVDDPKAKAEVVGNAYDRAPGLPVPHLPTSSFALLLARQPELSLFALSPGVLLWEGAEAQVPGLRLLALADPRPTPLPRKRAAPAAPLLLGLLGGALWWRWRV